MTPRSHPCALPAPKLSRQLVRLLTQPPLAHATQQHLTQLISICTSMASANAHSASADAWQNSRCEARTPHAYQSHKISGKNAARTRSAA